MKLWLSYIKDSYFLPITQYLSDKIISILFSLHLFQISQLTTWNYKYAIRTMWSFR